MYVSRVIMKSLKKSCKTSLNKLTISRYKCNFIMLGCTYIYIWLQELPSVVEWLPCRH